jgi:hypothetical protein
MTIYVIRIRACVNSYLEKDSQSSAFISAVRSRTTFAAFYFSWQMAMSYNDIALGVVRY